MLYYGSVYSTEMMGANITSCADVVCTRWVQSLFCYHDLTALLVHGCSTQLKYNLMQQISFQPLLVLLLVH